MTNESATTNFLPEKFGIPSKNDQFLKLKVGRNTLRVVNPSLIEGYEFFNEDNRPQRRQVVRENGIPTDTSYFTSEDLENMNAKKNADGTFAEPKYFWITLVYNYEKETFQAFVITQKTIQTAINNQLEDADFSDPSKYDFTISKTGEGLKTEYSVTAGKHKPLPAKAIQELETLYYNLEAVFVNEYPFDK